MWGHLQLHRPRVTLVLVAGCGCRWSMAILQKYMADRYWWPTFWLIVVEIAAFPSQKIKKLIKIAGCLIICFPMDRLWMAEEEVATDLSLEDRSFYLFAFYNCWFVLQVCNQRPHLEIFNSLSSNHPILPSQGISQPKFLLTLRYKSRKKPFSAVFCQ